MAGSGTWNYLLDAARSLRRELSQMQAKSGTRITGGDGNSALSGDNGNSSAAGEWQVVKS